MLLPQELRGEAGKKKFWHFAHLKHSGVCLRNVKGDKTSAVILQKKLPLSINLGRVIRLLANNVESIVLE